MGIPSAYHSGIFVKPDQQQGTQEEDTAGPLFAKLYFRHRSLWYHKDFPFRNRPGESAVWQPD